MPNDDIEVLIVGAGAAGIAAARRLHDAGVDCLLVEARDRLGGRAYTAQAGGFPLDLGCGWLHSADRNPWIAIAQAQGRTIDRTPPPWSRPGIGLGFPLDEQRAYRDAMNAFLERVGTLAKQKVDVAASQALEPGNRWNGLISAVCTYIAGAEPERVSALDFDNYDDTEINWRIVEGYGAVIAAHAAGVPVRLNCAVTRIDHSSKRLRAETTQGVVTADRVIVTLPTSVIAANEDLFAPALPEKIEAARGLPLGLADKLFLSLDGHEEFEPGGRLFGAIDRVATATYHFRPFGRPVIEVYFGGSNAAALEKGGVAAFADFAVRELVSHLGSGMAKRVKALAMHPWASDPLARGSYSYATPGRAGCRGVLAAAVEDRIYFAGEACSVHDFSTAHGAYRTGIAAAEAVLVLQERR
jgi:monoamine oxidase